MKGLQDLVKREWQYLPLEQAAQLLPVSDGAIEASYLIRQGLLEFNQAYVHVVGYECTKQPDGQMALYEGIVRSAMFVQSNLDLSNKQFRPEYSATRHLRSMDPDGLADKISAEMKQQELHLDFLVDGEVD